MKKNSTLVYFVTDFQPGNDSLKVESIKQTSENFLTAMENDDKVPSDQTIESILNFARSYEVLETEKTGYVEMNLN